MVMSGSRSMASVTARANASLSTASACPAGTAVWRAISISSDPARRISSLSSHGALFSESDLSEFEQTKFGEVAGFVSRSPPRGPHLEQLDGDAAPGALPRRFRAGQAGADNSDAVGHIAITMAKP